VSADIQGTYADVLSASDVVTYGSICALASFGRRQLKELIHNVEFKKLLEANAALTWKPILTAFYNSDYAKVFELLETIKVNSLRQRCSRRIVASQLLTKALLPAFVCVSERSLFGSVPQFARESSPSCHP
jgi:hypothetical protein